MSVSVEAPEFTVSDLQWSAIGSPTLSFVLTYQGSKMFAYCRYEAYNNSKSISSGTLSGSFSKGLPTHASVVFPLGTDDVTKLNLFSA